MKKILGLDSAYNEAIEKRGRNMLISANLVSEMVNRIRELEAATDEPLSHAKSLALYLQNNTGSYSMCLRDDLADFIRELKDN